MNYLLGVDFGGGASKATLLSAEGAVVATNTVEYPTQYPQPGYAEQRPEDWYAATRDNIAALLEKSGVDPAKILAISLDAATHTAVLLDGEFRVLRPAIYWTDSRSTREVAELREQYAELILEQAKHKPDTIWTLPQLMWVRRNEPEIWAKTEKIVFAKDYVRYLLTGVYCTDVIEAEGSMLFDLNRMDWSPELCGIIGFAPEKLPPLKKPSDIIGSITAHAAAETGLKEGTPVLCGTTDTVMEVFASGAIEERQTTVKLATAGRICVITKQAYPHQHLVNYSHITDGLWYPGTATKSCAASYRWYRDTFGGAYKELDSGAKNVPVGSEGLFYHPYLNGELTPYADPLLRGSFTGIRAGHTKAHFSRAVMEGVAFSLLECRHVLEEIGVPYSNEAAVIGGGAASPIWRQITADMLGIRLKQAETSDSSFGSAMMAGVAAGVFSDYRDALNRCVRMVSVTEPNAENTAKYAELFPLYREIHDALAPIYHKMK